MFKTTFVFVLIGAPVYAWAQAWGSGQYPAIGSCGNNLISTASGAPQSSHSVLRNSVRCKKSLTLALS